MRHPASNLQRAHGGLRVRSPLDLRKLLDDADELVAREAVGASKRDELAGFGDDCAALRRSDDADAAAAAELEQPLISQCSEGPQHGVGVDAEDGRKVSRGRQSLTVPGLAGGDGAADLRGYLVVKRRWLRAVDLVERHDASHTSSMAWDAVAQLGVIEDARRRQRLRRRRVAAWLVAAGTAVGVLYLAVDPGRDEPAQVPRMVAAEATLARAPYMGVSCATPNSIVCDRIGLAVWLRRPAQSVHAVVAGRQFALDDREWRGPRRPERRALFYGFLQSAGVVSHLGARPDRHGRWIGRGTAKSSVRLRIDFGSGDIAVTRVDVPLMAGWG